MDTKKLRQKILDLAIRGKLVPQDPNDEPASILLERIRAEKERLIAEGKIKRPKKSKTTSSESHYQNLPEGWVSTNLNDIAWFGGGKTPATDNDLFWENGSINWITSKDMKEPVIYKSKIQLSLLGASQNTLYPAGTLVMVIRSGILRRTLPLAILGHESTVNQDIKAICTPYYEITEYLYWYFTALETDILEQYQKDGTTVESIDFEKFQEIEIILPPFNELKRIIGQLISLLHLIDLITTNSDEIVETIEKTKSKILELAMQGKLVPQDPADEPAAEMLRRINPKANIITDNPHYPNLPNNWVLTDIQSVCNYGKCDSVNVNNINEGDWILELEDIEKDSGVILEKERKGDREVKGVRHTFQSGDILYSKLRTYLNKVLIAPTSGYCSTEIIPIKCHDSVTAQYLCAWLRSPYFLAYTQSCGYGVKMPRISTTDARNGIVPLPPLNEQRRIMEQVHSIFEVLDAISNSANYP